MDNTKETIKPEQIVEILLRRRWFIIAPFCLALIVGIFFAIKLPKTYQASTLILVEAQRVPQSYVQTVVSQDFDSRINTISQQILSRTNLEKIIKELNLYSDHASQRMFMEDKIEDLRKRIAVQLTQSRSRSESGAESFSISFKWRDPNEIVKVINTLASFFIDENLKLREEQAVGTSDFLEGELISERKKLEEVEEKMKEYRRSNMGELPEQLESNLRILDQIEQQIGQRRQRLSDEQQRLITFENQLMAGPPQNIPIAPVPSSDANAAQPANLAQLKERLAALRSKYTERHPDIVRLAKIVDDMEKAEKAKEGDNKKSSAAAMPRLTPANQRQLDDMKKLIKGLEKEVFDLNAQKAEYKFRVENTPKREQELMSLKRDYQNIQESYKSLLKRKLEAEISVNMEKKQKGERFRVIDSAKKPEKPIEPDMNKLFLFTIAAGLGIGGGIIFLLEYTDTSFRRTEDVESYLDLPVIATIPKLVHPRDLFMRKLHRLATGFSMIVSFGLLVLFTFVVLKGHEPLLRLIR